MTDFDDDGYGPSIPPGKPERFIANPNESTEPPPDGPFKPKQDRGSEYFMLLVGTAVLIVVALGIYLVKRPKPTPPAIDLGQAVFNAGGLRGHLVTRWQGKTAVYKLQIEPLDPTVKAGFAYVAGNPPMPIEFDIRILDSSGFALCSKQILMPFDPASVPSHLANEPTGRGRKAQEERETAEQADLQNRQAQEQQREKGQDVLQSKLGDDGKVVALYAQGDLPCTADQYPRLDYWDLSTNFPTLQEQNDLMTHKAEKAAAQARAERAAARRKAEQLLQSGFYVEGDVRVSTWDPVSGLLGSGAGKSFFIAKTSDRPLAAGWAASSTLIHYKCDQHGICVLKQAGSGAIIIASLNE